MRRPAGWDEANGRYLTAAVGWIRARLEAMAPPEPVPAPSPATTPAPSNRHLLGARTTAPGPLTLPAPAVSAAAERVKHAAEEMEAAQGEMGDDPPALIELTYRLGLKTFERDLLLLCVALELDTRIAGLCARAQDDPARTYPTFALALTLFEERFWEVLSPERPLRYWRLIEINQPGAQPLITSPMRADERVVNFIKGLDYLDDRLASYVAPLASTGAVGSLPPSQALAAAEIAGRWDPSALSFPMPVAQLVGTDGGSKEAVAWHASRTVGRVAYRVAAEALPPPGPDLERFSRLWQRESCLYPRSLYIDAQEVEAAAAGPAGSVARVLAMGRGAYFLASREAWEHAGAASWSIDVERPTRTEQQWAWEEALGDRAGDNPGRLAGQFSLDVGSIRQIARLALSTAREDGAYDDDELADRLWDACRDAVRPRLDALAQRLDPKVSWDDLILPDEPTRLLRQLFDQVGQRTRVYEDWGFARLTDRGFGISALFAGDSGTGKTLAAEVLAHELRLNLYRIDLSAVVSKYIGQTEKNLRRVFDAAEDGGAILFFDEADALFGKRSEVKDSHDRYANIEVNYLLQRMESFRGVAILATNMKSALDAAFQRRLRFIVKFPFPGLAERKRMWQRVFPHETPVESLDYDRLAKLNLTGGSIRNVALNAAFLAASAGTSVTMPLVLAAARGEFLKAEKPINEADFRWHEPVGAKP
ncbi:MAG TPA: ATP-binding protein [Isosphaeraceae bacterium]|jgi:hypothetical protein|nr:ATP-binding protein [Isosphaeraceae bacterium]